MQLQITSDLQLIYYLSDQARPVLASSILGPTLPPVRHTMALASMQCNVQIGAAQQLTRSPARTAFTAAPSQIARGRRAFVVRAEDTRDRGAQKLDSDSYQSTLRLSLCSR